jgi:hypothetical protein
MQCRHITVYDEEGKFAGWPANNGIWSFDNEIVVGFIQGTLEQKLVDGHKIDYTQPSYNRQSRSKDGGLTWAFEGVQEIATIKAEDIRSFDGVLNFLDPELAIRFVPIGLHDGAISPFFYSKNRCKTWIGPFETPSMGLRGISARTEFLPLSEEEALLFFACPKSDGYEGRAAVAKISKGGKKFSFLSYIGDEPPGFTIMPASFRRNNGDIVAVIREEDRFDNPNRGARLTQYVSCDEGKTWTFNQYIDQFTHSTPPAVATSITGRLYLTYGYRDKPQGICAKISDDEGHTWSDRYILRDDGGSTDLGYTRLTALPDGSMFTAYYYNTHKDGGRVIYGSIFRI